MTKISPAIQEKTHYIQAIGLERRGPVNVEIHVAVLIHDQDIPCNTRKDTLCPDYWSRERKGPVNVEIHVAVLIHDQDIPCNTRKDTLYPGYWSREKRTCKC